MTSRWRRTNATLVTRSTRIGPGGCDYREAHRSQGRRHDRGAHCVGVEMCFLYVGTVYADGRLRSRSLSGPCSAQHARAAGGAPHWAVLRGVGGIAAACVIEFPCVSY